MSISSASPRQPDSLSRTFHTVHMQYSRYFNSKRDAVGHLWQGRFFSCTLDERHVYAAIRYVELNPVRGGLAPSPEDYPWSSAKCHITGERNPVLSGRCFLAETVTDWRRFLGMEPDAEAESKVIKATITGRPCGSEEFIKGIEGDLGRRLTPGPRGRPRKSNK
jgi:putative transposase